MSISSFLKTAPLLFSLKAIPGVLWIDPLPEAVSILRSKLSHQKIVETWRGKMYFNNYLILHILKPGFHISQFTGDLLSGIVDGENNFRNTKRFCSSLTTDNKTTRTFADELRYV